jgi:hypothetical protein
MELLGLFTQNLLSPIILAFFLGFVAKLIKSDLQIPEQILKGISIYLLLSIGLKGGNSFIDKNLSELIVPVLVTMLIVLVMPIWTYFIAKKFGKLKLENAAGVAAVYSSVSSVTFITALAVAEKFGTPAESFMPSLVTLMELTVIVSLFVAKFDLKRNDSFLRNTKFNFMEILTDTIRGRSFVLLIGGMLIGFLIGEPGYAKISPMYDNLFYGVLTFFLLEMGMVAAGEIKGFLKVGKFMLAFGIIMPLIHGVIGTYLGSAMGLSVGGSFVFGTILASSSYIDAPVIVKATFPKSNPAIYLTSSLGITFPFNLLIGIPIYYELARFFVG